MAREQLNFYAVMMMGNGGCGGWPVMIDGVIVEVNADLVELNLERGRV